MKLSLVLIQKIKILKVFTTIHKIKIKSSEKIDVTFVNPNLRTYIF